MIDKKSSGEEKKAELLKFRELVLATIDYNLDNKELHIKTSDFDSNEYYIELKKQTQEQFQKGNLIKLKQWFRDLTEMQVETRNLKFNKYLQDKTKYDIDIFKNYLHLVDKIIKKDKITTVNQFYDISIMAEQLIQTEPIDNTKIEILNRLLADYEQRKLKKI